MILDKTAKIGCCTPIPFVDGPAGKRMGMLTTEFHRARMALASPFGHNMTEIAADGMEIGEARTLVCQRAIELGLRYLFFLDWDVLPPPAAVHRLVMRAENAPEVDVFAGVYCVKMEPACPLIYKAWGDGVYWDWTPGDVLDVVGCGMGCTVIRLDCLKRLENTEANPWFKTERVTQDGTAFHMTEDLWFCRRLTEEAGGKIRVDTGILCAHIDPATGKQYVLPEDSIPGRRLKEKPKAA